MLGAGRRPLVGIVLSPSDLKLFGFSESGAKLCRYAKLASSPSLPPGTSSLRLMPAKVKREPEIDLLYQINLGAISKNVSPASF